LIFEESTSFAACSLISGSEAAAFLRA